MLIIVMLLVTVCIALIIYYRKKFITFVKLADKKEQQIRDIISDAELMINELNDFSDYIISEVEKRNMEFRENIQNYQKEINYVGQKAEELQKIMNNVCSNPEMPKDEEMYKTETDSVDKFMSLNNKYREVIRLSNEGVEETEIARQLNIGKGEVRLVLQFIR